MPGFEGGARGTTTIIYRTGRGRRRGFGIRSEAKTTKIDARKEGKNSDKPGEGEEGVRVVSKLHETRRWAMMVMRGDDWRLGSGIRASRDD